MNLTARMPTVVLSSTAVSSVKRSYGSQNPWSSIAKEDRLRRPDKGTDLFEASDHHYLEQFMESFSSTSYSKLDDDCAWSSQEWKTETTTYDRSGQLDKTSWSMVQQDRPHRGETLLDGVAQSVRYGGILRDRSGQPDNINSQEQAESETFVMGSDAAEFVSRVNDQVRKRQNRMSNVAGSGEEHSIIW